MDLSIDVAKAVGSERGLVVPSGSHWVLHPDFVLRAKPTSQPKYEILRLHDKSDIVIEGAGARIVGEREGHKGGAGQWGMGVSIRGSTNIRISELHAEDCWGDGWYIGSTHKQTYCQDVHLERISSDRARRNGLSLISARGFVCVDGRFSNTQGTAPQWGIDLEPNYRFEFLEDVTFVRPKTERNADAGIGLFLRALSGAKNPVSIRFLDAQDIGSIQGMVCARADNVRGVVEILDLVSKDARFNAVAIRNWQASAPRLRLVRASLIDWNRARNSSLVLSAGILIHAAKTDSGVGALGNVEVIEPKLKLNSGSAASAIAVSDLRGTSALPTGIEIRDPVDLAGLPMSFGRAADIRFADRHRKSATKLADASQTLAPSAYFMHYVTPNLTRKPTYDINANHGNGIEMIFEIGGSGGPAHFRFPAGTRLSSPNILGRNRLIFSSEKGALLHVRKVSADEWRIVKKTGEWTGA